MKVQFVNAEVLRLRPGEVLIIKASLPADADNSQEIHASLSEYLSKLLGDRFVLILGDVELAVVEDAARE